jgi:heme-degrading monooxygenase HmoA
MKFVFEVHLHPGYTVEQYAAAWVRASEIIQRAPGARGTRLHRKAGDPRVLVAVASWASKADRDAMEACRDERVAAILDEQARHCDVRVIGELEEAEWCVDPESPDAVAAAGAQRARPRDDA